MSNFETYHNNLAGNQSRPAKRAGSRNRVLGGVRVTCITKRTQGACRPCYRWQIDYKVQSLLQSFDMSYARSFNLRYLAITSAYQLLQKPEICLTDPRLPLIADTAMDHSQTQSFDKRISENGVTVLSIVPKNPSKERTAVALARRFLTITRCSYPDFQYPPQSLFNDYYHTA